MAYQVPFFAHFLTLLTEVPLVSASLSNTSLVAAPCAEEEVSRHGMLELDQEMRVTSFLEKPAPAETRSRTQSPCCYLLSPGAVR